MIIRLPDIGAINAITLTPNLIIAFGDAIYSSIWLHEHEKVHQQQMREMGTLTFWFKYLTSKKSRLSLEVDAYYDSYQRVPNMLYVFATALSKHYMLNISVEECAEMIRTGIAK